MEYSFEEFKLEQVFELIEKERFDLNPSYQRNFIWSSINQMELIDTILKKYPLPSFFYYLRNDGKYEVVDGQQRTKTIYRFIKGQITSSKHSGKVSFDNIDKNAFLNYRIPVIIIKNLSSNDSLREFYVLINKKGVHLNPAEVSKSEFHETNFLKLSDQILEYQNLINLDLFTEATSKRMNDRSFIEELAAYLIYGIKDKKDAVEAAYEGDISESESKSLYKKFTGIIDIIQSLNTISPISYTRYKQKNDFYTLFCFVNENINQSQNLWNKQYEILQLLDGEDNDGRQIIRPSNEECDVLKEYANNCITQSNSKNSREKRLAFFNSILKNTSPQGNDAVNDIVEYFSSSIGKTLSLKKLENYYLID